MKNLMKPGVFGIIAITVLACDGEGTTSTYNELMDSHDHSGSETVKESQIEPYYPAPPVYQDVQNEQYAHVEENHFQSAITQPRSTFSIDVDNASYTNIRRILNQGQLPNPDAVRIEEMINYFDYQYAPAPTSQPFTINPEVAQCPWNQEHKLVRIGIQGMEVSMEKLPPSNLVFLLDVSGSMSSHNKLPLLKRSFNQMVDQLGEKDFVSVVTYAGQTRVALPPTSCANKGQIKAAMNNLFASGGTNGAGGIQMAYQQAELNLLENGNNRIFLATDGDFNIGISDKQQLIQLIESKRDKGIDLTVLGFGMGNIKDDQMEALASNGNGNYFYIDSDREARNVLVDNLSGTLLTIAKDVKIQVEFNPARVSEYRLIGYENKKLTNQDFHNAQKDAGELGAGHTVTALYEITPAGANPVDKGLKYQSNQIKSDAYETSELLTVQLHYKHPKTDKGYEITSVVLDQNVPFSEASRSFRLAACVGGFGMLLRNSQHKGGLSYSQLIGLSKAAVTASQKEEELVQLMHQAGGLNDIAAHQENQFVW